MKWEKTEKGFIYTGILINGIFTGNYTLIYPSGNHAYQGYMKNNLFHGEGTLYWVHGPIYSGQWYQGRAHGWGNLYDSATECCNYNRNRITKENFPTSCGKKIYEGVFFNNKYGDEINFNDLTGTIEGRMMIKQHITYERNKKNREICLSIHGYKCAICGASEKEYGDHIYKIIEVHHVRPVSNGSYRYDPEKDLIPLCSNCHKIIHSKLFENSTDNIEKLKASFLNHMSNFQK